MACLIANWTPALTQDPGRVVTQSGSGVPVFQVQSNLVVVRVMVVDRRVWRDGASAAGQKCAFAAEQALYRLPATEPYLPPECDGIFIRGLTAKDFHLLVDGEEQKIESVTSESAGLRVRDNQGLHHTFSQTPAGIWSTTDFPVPRYIYTGAVGYGLEARNRYDISFVPQGSGSVGCHTMRVKVDRRNSIVAARDEYCAGESPSDILNGSSFGNGLERDLASGQPGRIPLDLQTAVLEGDRGGGRVRIALEFPMAVLHRHWSQDWFEQATIGVLGMIYKQNGPLAFRFSDFACCTPYSSGAKFGMQGTSLDRFTAIAERLGLPAGFVSKELASIETGTLPTRYETHFDLPPGEYDLRIILSDGENFGRAEAHLKVENNDGKEFALSSVMLCNRFLVAHVAETEMKAANFAPQYVPLVSKGVQVTPAGDTTFSPSETLIAYFEVYAPQLATGTEPGIQAHMRIVDAKNGALVKDFPVVDAATYEQAGSTVIPIARAVPIANLPKGQYRLEVQATDSPGHSTPWQAANFTIVQ